MPMHGIKAATGRGRDPAEIDGWLESLFGKRYRRRDAMRVIEIVRDPRRDHGTRNVAALVLEHLTLRLPPGAYDEFDALFVALGIKPEGSDRPLADGLLREGYTSTELRAFTAQFRRRLGRLNRFHRRLGKGCRGPADRAEIRHLAAQDCKITLCRYLVRPAEVVARLRSRTGRSRGVTEPLSEVSPLVRDEADRTLASLPQFEAAIVTELCTSAEIYWHSADVPERLNAILESPLGTVVTVLKPPGSPLEFEIKRTGMRRGPLLDVVHSRDGEAVPAAHRLQGGSMGSLLRYEAKAAAVLARFYRLVHGREAPLNSALAIKSITALPTETGEVQLLDYLTEPACFGPGFESMRTELSAAVTAFDRESGEPPLEIGGPWGLSSRFLAHFGPKQGVFAGTSSFRLDRLARYLSADGPRCYFGDGLGRAHSPNEARRFADDLLDEVLGVYTPPATRYRDHGRYLDAAYELTTNRARADRHFSAAMAQFGCLWGTLLGARGYSSGESFVARNVGLKSVWEQGQWQVQLRFMDHDNLRIGHPGRDFHPLRALDGVCFDAMYLFGWGDTVTGSAEYLEKIYRVSVPLARRGREVLFRAAREAYRTTQTAIMTEPRVRAHFHPQFADRLGDWDEVLAGRLRCGDARELARWEIQARGLLKARGYDEALTDEHVQAAGRYLECVPQLARMLHEKS